MRIGNNRLIAAVTAVALAAGSFAFTAGPAAARPYHHRHYYHHHIRGPGAAVLGAVAGLFGTVATLAARDAYYDSYGYYVPYYGPYYGPPAYGYYGPGPYFYPYY